MKKEDAATMPRPIRFYVKTVDWVSHKIGLIAMYLIFLMILVLLTDAISRNIINLNIHWAIEMAQFTLAAYYIVGGAHSLQMGTHVRMDLIYGQLSDRGKAWVDVLTSGFMLFYLGILLFGSISSTIYAIETDQRNFSMWNPSMIPIKVIMVFGIVLMLLQVISTFFKDLAATRGVTVDGDPIQTAHKEEPVV
ncbi:TRAP transporter small permease subunit [Fodinicurvata sediminis]|uniref:TRAP transporter small permease subunit n=1 Tax=Fodinicurvata sediminis TaxID=1121832 RepID=UPI0003B622ED|nr:TRAP transporter small permease subunit [Fodinicurvata sediminis]